MLTMIYHKGSYKIELAFSLVMIFLYIHFTAQYRYGFRLHITVKTIMWLQDLCPVRLRAHPKQEEELRQLEI
jgi:hypothetical protein